MIRLIFLPVALAFSLFSGAMATMAAEPPSPILIAHRGASAERPEHTLAAYALAIAQGADFIEPDLVMTKDGHLVARHENEIGSTTDVADRLEFANRRTTKTIDGETVRGWFTEDFTLAELKTLRTRERLPQLRPGNIPHDGRETIPTFAEILALAAAADREIGVYPETKHPTYFRQIGLPMEETLLDVLKAHGHDAPASPIFIQSFEVGNLMALRQKTRLRLIQLAAGRGAPADRPETPYAAMLTPAGLQAIARYADGIGVEKSTVIPRGPDGNLGAPTSLVADAHAAGLKVHVWTFRPENYFLPKAMQSSDNPVETGDAAAEIRAYLATGIDGLFSDSIPPAMKALSR